MSLTNYQRFVCPFRKFNTPDVYWDYESFLIEDHVPVRQDHLSNDLYN